jgi:hypothetical protein
MQSKSHATIECKPSPLTGAADSGQKIAGQRWTDDPSDLATHTHESAGPPFIADLCCGDGGFTDGLMSAGHRVLGFDITRFPGYRGELILRDIRTLSGLDFRGRCYFIVAGPPCQEFSRHKMPWTRKRNPPEPDLSLVEACFRIAREAGVPLLLENVETARRWLGPAGMHYGPHYFWGDGVPALYPIQYFKKKKESFGGKQAHLRARVPDEFSQWLGAIIPFPAGSSLPTEQTEIRNGIVKRLPVKSCSLPECGEGEKGSSGGVGAEPPHSAGSRGGEPLAGVGGGGAPAGLLVLPNKCAAQGVKP